MSIPLDQAYRSYLRRLLVERFSLDELRTLCFDLGIDAEILPVRSKQDLAREVLAYLTRRRRLQDLVTYIRSTREDIQLASTPPSSVSRPAPSGAAAHVAAQAGPSLSPVWELSLSERPVAAPIALGLTCLVATESSTVARGRAAALWALDIPTGRIKWRRRLGAVRPGALLAVGPDRFVMTLSSTAPPDESALHLMDVRGQSLWHLTFDVSHLSDATICGAHLVLTDGRRRLMRVSRDGGIIESTLSLDVDLVDVAPACDDQGIYLACQTPALLALDPQGGVRWRYEVEGVLAGTHIDQTPRLVDALVVFALNSGELFAVRRTDGRLAWNVRVGPRGKGLTRPLSDGHALFIGARDGLYALDVHTGGVRWVLHKGLLPSISPVLVDGTLCLVGDDQHLYGVDPQSGRLLWRWPLDVAVEVPPILAQGDDNGPYVLLATYDGKVLARSYPVSAQAHERAGRWHKAALLWEEAGDVYRAARAWQRRATDLARRGGSEKAQAAAWAKAAHHFALADAREQAVEARRAQARCLGLPLIAIDVEHAGLNQGAWSSLEVVIRNEGYGVARDVRVRVASDQVESDSPEIRPAALLRSGESRRGLLRVRPRAHGDSVPLRFELSYTDPAGEVHRQQVTLYLSVARRTDSSIPGVARLISELTDELARLRQGGDELPVVDVEIRLSPGTGEYRAELTLDGRQVFTGVLPVAIVNWRPSGDLRTDGQSLFERLFQDRVIRKGWDVARGKAESLGAIRRVRLRIDDEAAELHRLPWELMCDDGLFIAANAQTPFSRYLPVQASWGHPLLERPIRVLAAIANPRDVSQRYRLTPLDVERERFVLASAFAGIDPQHIRLSFLKPPVTLERLAQALQKGYHWLHFVGHGWVNARQAQLSIILENEQRESRAVTAHLFSSILTHHGAQPQLVFLSMCHSAVTQASRPAQDPSLGLGPQLIRAGIPAVVAMRDQVSIRTTHVLARTFYEAAASHGIADRALNQAREAVLAAELPGIASPILFMRLSSGQLWQRRLEPKR